MVDETGSRWRRLGRATGGAAVAGAAVATVPWLLYRDRPVEELEDEYTDEASAFVEVDGLRVHYRDEGDPEGPTLVCLHGMFSSLHTWDGWVERLGDRFRLVRLDLPGFGLTGPHPEGDHGMEATVDFLDRFLDAVEVDEPVLAGSSRGGGIAWRYAHEHPDRVDRLVLVDATGYPLKDPPAIYWLATVPGLRQFSRTVTPRWIVRQNVEQVFADDGQVTEELVEQYHDLLLRAGNRRAVLEIADADLPVDRHDDIPEVEVPTLVLWGEEDEWIPLSDGRRFGRDLPDAKLVTYEGVGHVPQAEVPGRSAADVRAFLDGRPTAADGGDDGTTDAR
jgi:pimeloyl-ACP methyl ester carboxylesterase